MSVERLRNFVDSLAFEKDIRWWIKRLSANDTQQTGGNQAGPYVPRQVLFEALPELKLPHDLNPRVVMDAEVVSHRYTATVSAIWYNNKLHRGTRDETRLTGWGGSGSPLLDHDYTGAAAVFAFGGDPKARWCRVWICETEDETDFIEERFGTIEPGKGVLFPPSTEPPSPGGCGLPESEIPDEWLVEFPSPNDILEMSLEMKPQYSILSPDRRLVRRRDCEYELFQSIETAMWLPRVRSGFETIGEFVSIAQTILQRRRSRSGKSLERHLRRILAEADLLEGHHFDEQVETEEGKIPDFIFPSEAAYHDDDFDDHNLRMLAAKTTLRERWTQVPGEAKRIRQKHLLTLQEGVSASQYTQMRARGLKLVVPEPLHSHYPMSIRDELQTLESFIEEVSSLPQ